MIKGKGRSSEQSEGAPGSGRPTRRMWIRLSRPFLYSLRDKYCDYMAVQGSTYIRVAVELQARGHCIFGTDGLCCPLVNTGISGSLAWLRRPAIVEFPREGV